MKNTGTEMYRDAPENPALIRSISADRNSTISLHILRGCVLSLNIISALVTWKLPYIACMNSNGFHARVA